MSDDWGPGWFVLADGRGMWLEDLTPCSCGGTVFLHGRWTLRRKSGGSVELVDKGACVYCPRCIRPRRNERVEVVGWFDATSRAYSEGPPPAELLPGSATWRGVLR